MKQENSDKPDKQPEQQEEKSLKLYYWGKLTEEQVAAEVINQLTTLDPDCNVILSPQSAYAGEDQQDELWEDTVQRLREHMILGWSNTELIEKFKKEISITRK